MADCNIRTISLQEQNTQLLNIISSLRLTNERLVRNMNEITNDIVSIKKELRKIRYGIIEKKGK